MKIGDLIRFKKTNKIGMIVSIEKKRTPGFIVVDVLHDVVGIPNPSGFTLSNLRKTAEVINESR